MGRKAVTSSYCLTPEDQAYIKEIKDRLEQAAPAGVAVSASAAIRHIIDQHRSFFSADVVSEQQIGSEQQAA